MNEDEPGRTTGGPPVRLVSRLNAEAGLLSLHHLLALVPGRFETAVVMQAVVRGALYSIVRSGTFVVPERPVAAGSIKALARSFGKPVETMRRHAQTLARLGYVTVTADGLQFAPDQEVRERVLTFLDATHDLMLWLVAQLYGWRLLRQPANPHRTVSREAIARFGLDLMLLPFESYRGAFGTWTDFAIWNALGTASVRRITTDRELSAVFSSRSTPDDERQAIGLRVLSEASGLSYGTTWRRVSAMERAGLIAQRDEKYVVLTGLLRSEAMEERVVLAVQQTLARANELIASGLDPRSVKGLYIGTEPRLAAIRGLPS